MTAQAPHGSLPPALRPLAERTGEAYLHRRLAIEAMRTQRALARERIPMRWLNRHALIRTGLQWSGLRARGRRNVLDIQLRQQDVALAGLPAAFAGYTLLQLSDLHLDMDTAFEAALIARLRGLRFDACVLTGDYRYRSHGPTAPVLAALARLRPLLGETVWAVLGNHDALEMVPPMEAMGLRVLLNEAVALAHGGARIGLAGVDDAHAFRLHDVPAAARALPAGDCAILLSHTPEPYRQAAAAGFGLMLSGHTHGGQICLPGGAPILADLRTPRRYLRGAWQHGAMQGYTSVGCGASIVDVRLNCLPEVTLHRLLRAGPQKP